MSALIPTGNRAYCGRRIAATKRQLSGRQFHASMPDCHETAGISPADALSLVVDVIHSMLQAAASFSGRKTMNMDRRVWRLILIFTLAVSFATAVGNIASSSILGGARLEEAQARATIERRAKGAQFHCEKLQQAASLAAEIDFRVTRNEAGATSLGNMPGKVRINRPAKADWSEIEQEQRAFEKRTSQLIPFLEKTEALLLEEITLSHDAIMSLQQGGAERPIRLRLAAATPDIETVRDGTGVAGASAKLVRASQEDSVLPQGQRPVPSGNQGLAVLRVNAAELARMYRAKCSEDELASGQ